MKKYVVNIGDRFGRLVVLRRNKEYITKNRAAFYDVRCDCGTEFTTRKLSLVRGHTRSCGCLRNESLIERNHNRNHNYSRVTITYNGEEHTMQEWSVIFGVSRNTLYTRRARHGDDPSYIFKGLKRNGNKEKS